MIRSSRLATIMLLIVFVRSASAQITYQLVGQTAGDLSAEGTITTDGTLGTLGIANVISSNIVVSSPTESIQLLPVPYDFRGVTATPTVLSYDGASLEEDVFFGADTNMHVWDLTHEFSPFRFIQAGDFREVEDISLPHIFAVLPEPPLVKGGWDAILPPGLEDYVDVVDNGTDLVDGELVNFLTITADFKQGPSNGRFPSIPIAFRQTHEDAAEYIVIEEQINFNSSGGDWTGFEFTLAGGGAVFDLANTEASGGPAPIGYSVAPFTSAQFTDDNTRLAISAGRVDNGALWFPGSGTNDGQLWIDVTPGSEGDFSNFTFLQRPVAVPEPGTISMLAIGLAIILLRRSPERVTRDP